MIDAQSIMVCRSDQEQINLLAESCQCSRLLAHLMINRGIKTPDQVEKYFKASTNDLYNAEEYPGVVKATDLIAASLSKGEKIFVCGDYDVDGITASAILLLGLRRLQAQIECHLPHRFSEGFGLSQEGVEAALSYGANLLITVDCGSSSADSVAYAKSRGLKVIVTDHHQIEGKAACPDVFVNANLEGHKYPFSKLCGAGVAWKLLCAVFKRFSLPEPFDLLDMVAMATLCDMVPLIDENRTLAMLGLPMFASLERSCFKILTEGCKVAPDSINAQSILFSIGPKINACGRMDRPDCALELLLAQSPEVCRLKVGRLIELSEERHRVESATFREIEEQLSVRQESKQSCIFVYGHWHKGVLGICAQRVMDIYRIPVFVATDDDGQLMGSARAPEGVNLLDIFALCCEHLEKYGGHANAGGFTLKKGAEEAFRKSLNEACIKLEITPPKKIADAYVPIHKLSIDLVRELERLEPTGKENEKPTFLASGVRVVSRLRPMGKFGTSVSFQIADDHFPIGRAPIKAVAFNKVKDLAILDIKNCTISLLYNVEVNIWAGRSELQVTIKDFIAPDPRLAEILPQPDEQNQVFAPYEEAGRIVSLLDRSAYLQSIFAQTDLPKRLIDGRNILDKPFYLQCIINNLGETEGEKRILIVGESAEQNHQFSLGINNESCRFILSMDTYIGEGGTSLLAKNEVYNQVVLLAPPLQLEFFQLSCIKGADKIHVLFSHEQILNMRRRLSSYALNYENVADTYRWLIRFTEQGRKEQAVSIKQLKAVAKELNMETIKLQRSLKVLEQLGLLYVSEVERGNSVWRFRKPKDGSKLDLSSSPLYCSASKLVHDFEEIRQSFNSFCLKEDFLSY
ncbi:MAG: single-stranded-DNA-specific exonuclease RecJ [Candidatus Bruticola sp.]